MTDGCDHVWEETEVGCEDCGSHRAIQCEECYLTVDLVMRDDPREGK